nr:retrovirus-related Pol polyprotein from transposon TNT 1-94 [Tanacetum cinerariifolium]
MWIRLHGTRMTIILDSLGIRGRLRVSQGEDVAVQGVPLQAEQYDWLADTDEEIDKQELEAHYSYMAKIQKVPTADTGTNSEPLEHVQNEARYNVFAKDLQHSELSESVKSDDERVALANLITNLKLDVDENKKIQKQLKKENTTLAQELKECKAILAETSKTPRESNSVWDSCLVSLQNKQTEFEKYKAFNDHLKAQLQDKNIAISGLKKLIEKGKGKSVNTKFDQPSIVRQQNAQRIPKPSVLGKPNPFSNSLERKYFSKTKLVPKTNVSKGLSKPVTAQTLPHTARQAVSNTNVLKPRMYRINNRSTQTRAPQIVQLILFIVDSGCMKHMTGNLKLLCNFVEKFLEVAFWKSTCFVRDLQGNDLLTGNHGSDLYTISLQESTSLTPLCLMAKASPTQAWLWHRRLSHLNFDYINLLLKKDIVIGLPKLKYVKDQLCSSCELSKAKRSSFKSNAVPSSKGRQNLLPMAYVVQCGLLA